HIGPSIMGFEDEVERSFRRLAVGRSKQTCELTSSIVPRETSFHRLVELEFPPTSNLVWCSRCNFPVPSELGAINPDAMHEHRQAAGQRDNRSFHAAALGNLHRPSLEPRPSRRTHQHALGCLIEHGPHHLVPTARYRARAISFTG